MKLHFTKKIMKYFQIINKLRTDCPNNRNERRRGGNSYLRMVSRRSGPLKIDVGSDIVEEDPSVQEGLTSVYPESRFYLMLLRTQMETDLRSWKH
jgi:hypothetical protein